MRPSWPRKPGSRRHPRSRVHRHAHGTHPGGEGPGAAGGQAGPIGPGRQADWASGTVAPIAISHRRSLTREWSRPDGDRPERLPLRRPPRLRPPVKEVTGCVVSAEPPRQAVVGEPYNRDVARTPCAKRGTARKDKWGFVSPNPQPFGGVWGVKLQQSGSASNITGVTPHTCTATHPTLTSPFWLKSHRPQVRLECGTTGGTSLSRPPWTLRVP